MVTKPHLDIFLLPLHTQILDYCRIAIYTSAEIVGYRVFSIKPRERESDRQ